VAAIKKAEATVKAVADAALPFQSTWEDRVDLSTEWVPLDVTVGKFNGVEKLEKQADGSVFATPYADGREVPGNYLISAEHET